MTATLSLTINDIFTALRAFLLDVAGPGWEVVQGQVNRVPSPIGDNYMVMWPTLQRRLSTNIVTGVDTGSGELDANTYKDPTEIHIQVDVHGDLAFSVAQMVQTLFRSPYACSFLGTFNGGAIQPLYADDPQQMAFGNGEKQVEDRWVIQAVLQANPVTTTVQQFADVVTVGLIEIDATYPPGA